MRVICPHCAAKSAIYKRNQISDSVSELYCQCSNELCCAGFVMTLAHKHDTRPPISEVDHMVVELVSRMSQEEKKAIMALLDV